MRKMIVVPFAVCGFCVSAAIAGAGEGSLRGMDLYLLMGQSNMVGCGDLPDNLRVNADRVYKLDAEGKWQIADEPIHQGRSVGAGLAASFARAMADRRKDAKIGLIPCAVGGSGIDRWVEGGDLWSNAVARTRIALKSGTLKGFLWHQGELDATSQKRMSVWGEKLASVVKSMRAEFGAVPFVAGELGHYLDGYKPARWWREINAQMHGLEGKVPSYCVVSAAGLSSKSDGLHFDSRSLREFGVRYANAMLRIMQKPAADDAARMNSGMMNPGSGLGTVERLEGGDFKVLVYGNSIALHGPKSNIGWTNNWGMAASAAEKDFAHLVVSGLEAKLGRKADYRIRNIAALERNFTTNIATVAEIAADVEWSPDYVVVAIGENVGGLGEADAPAYCKFLAEIARPFAERGALIVMRSPFWRNAVKSKCTEKAAAEVGAACVDAGSLGSSDKNKAKGLFWHSGVANHPGDLGMRRIADLILAGFAEPRVARTIRPAGTGFTFNPELNTFLPLNDDYAVSLNGRKVEVRACRESRIPFNRYWPGRQRPLDQTERASYLAFEAEGAVMCRVKPKWKCPKAVVRPLSVGVKPAVSGDGAISFTLPKAGHYVLETDGPHKALHIFMESPRSFSERAGATLSYGPGMHVAGLVRLRSHDRVYIDRDAIVFGCFTGENVEDVKIFGHGVIDGRVCERVFEGGYTPLQQSCLRFHGSKGIEIDGPILMDSPNWVLACFDCEDVDIRHVKIVGQWRYNTDGIDICNSRRVAVSDCFVRSFDDAIVIKGVPPYKDKAVEDVTVERCVMWCGWGKTIEPGVETWAPRFRRVRFSDCDILRSAGSALNISAGGTAEMEDIHYENVRVEMQADNPPQIFQRSDDMRYGQPSGHSFPALVKVDNGHYGQNNGEPYGHVRNCTFRNIAVFAEPGVPPPSIKVMSLTPPGGKTRPFENVTFEDFSINGKAADWSAFSFTTNTPIVLVRP